MFMVFFNNRPAGKLKFSSYERGRQYARKLCRQRARRLPGLNYTEFSSNPMIGTYGYSVKQV